MTARRALGTSLRVAVVAVVVVACAALLRRLDLRAVGSALAGSSLPLVLAATTLNLGQVFLRALYVKAMLAPVRTVGALRLWRYLFAFYAANNLLPGRAGELVRIHLLRTREDVPALAAISVAVVEKAFDAIALLLLALPLPLLLPGLPRSVTVAMLLLGAGGLGALVAAWLVARLGDAARGRLGRLADGAAVVRRAGPFATALALSLVTHVADAVAIALCLAAVGIHAPPAAPLLVLLALAVTLAVPSTPSGLGAFELAAVAALRLLGVAPERALAFALVYHAMQVIPVTLLGLDGIRLALVRAPVD